jgi:hypothetical protein
MRASLPIASLLTIASCASGQAARDNPAPTYADATTNCNAPAGWENIEKASAGKIVFFGEVHGTREGPKAVGEYVCEVSKLEGTTVLAVEFPGGLNEALRQGLQSSEPEKFWLDNLENFWNLPPEMQGGRKSRAMLDLLLRVHQLKRAGHNVELYAFLPTPEQEEANASSEGLAWRYETEAENIRRLKQSYDRVIVMVGNAHADKEPRYPAFLPTASFLSEDSISINELNNGGAIWACLSGGECGKHQIRASSLYEKFASESGDQIRLTDEMKPYYDGYLLLGVVNASPPAIYSSGR